MELRLVCTDGARRPIAVRPGAEVNLGRACTYACAEATKVSRRVGTIRAGTEHSHHYVELSVEKEAYKLSAGGGKWEVLTPGRSCKARAFQRCELHYQEGSDKKCQGAFYM